jgi:hypothetical protein
MNGMRRPPEAGMPRIHYSDFARRFTLTSDPSMGSLLVGTGYPVGYFARQVVALDSSI